MSVLGQGLRLTLAGIFACLAGAYFLARFTRSLLFQDFACRSGNAGCDCPHSDRGCRDRGVVAGLRACSASIRSSRRENRG